MGGSSDPPMPVLHPTPHNSRAPYRAMPPSMESLKGSPKEPEGLPFP